jgi:hypothetical protein
MRVATLDRAFEPPTVEAQAIEILDEAAKTAAQLVDRAATLELVLQVEEFVVLLIPVIALFIVEVVGDVDLVWHRASFIVGTKEASPAGEASGS